MFIRISSFISYLKLRAHRQTAAVWRNQHLVLFYIHILIDFDCTGQSLSYSISWLKSFWLLSLLLLYHLGFPIFWSIKNFLQKIHYWIQLLNHLRSKVDFFVSLWYMMKLVWNQIHWVSAKRMFCWRYTLRYLPNRRLLCFFLAY